MMAGWEPATATVSAETCRPASCRPAGERCAGRPEGPPDGASADTRPAAPRIPVAPTSQCGSARPAGNGISCWPRTGRTLVWLKCARIIEKETQHFLRCIRPLRIRIGPGRTASGPGVAGAVDIPVLQDLASAVGVGGSGIAMPSRNLPAMHLLLRLGRSDDLFDSLGAVVGMYGGVAVAMENDGWDLRAACNSLAAGSAALTHRGERRGHVGGGSVGEAGMDPDRSVEIAVGGPHDRRSGASGRKTGDKDALGIDRIVLHDLAGDARDQR